MLDTPNSSQPQSGWPEWGVRNVLADAEKYGATEKCHISLYLLQGNLEFEVLSPDPLGDGPVLLALLGQDPLHAEGLQSRHGEKRSFTSAKALRV